MIDGRGLLVSSSSGRSQASVWGSTDSENTTLTRPVPGSTAPPADQVPAPAANQLRAALVTFLQQPSPC